MPGATALNLESLPNWIHINNLASFSFVFHYSTSLIFIPIHIVQIYNCIHWKSHIALLVHGVTPCGSHCTSLFGPCEDSSLVINLEAKRSEGEDPEENRKCLLRQLVEEKSLQFLQAKQGVNHFKQGQEDCFYGQRFRRLQRFYMLSFLSFCLYVHIPIFRIPFLSNQ